MEHAHKREKEKELMAEMVALYCRGQKHDAPKGLLCTACRQLLAYSATRTDHCPHMATKTFCSKCPTHCYKPDKREEVRQVMRYAGPRLLFCHPLALLRHMLAPKSTLAKTLPHATETRKTT